MGKAEKIPAYFLTFETLKSYIIWSQFRTSSVLTEDAQVLRDWLEDHGLEPSLPLFTAAPETRPLVRQWQETYDGNGVAWGWAVDYMFRFLADYLPLVPIPVQDGKNHG